jgi:hypothetical protein
VRAWEPQKVTEACRSLQSQIFGRYPRAWADQSDPLQETSLGHWDVLTAYSRTLLFSPIYNSPIPVVFLSDSINKSIKHVKDVPIGYTHQYSMWASSVERTDQSTAPDGELVELLHFISLLKEAIIGRKLCTLRNANLG